MSGKIKGQIKQAYDVAPGNVIIFEGKMLKVLFTEWHVGRRMVISCIALDALPLLIRPCPWDKVFIVTDERLKGDGYKVFPDSAIG